MPRRYGSSLATRFANRHRKAATRFTVAKITWVTQEQGGSAKTGKEDMKNDHKASEDKASEHKASEGKVNGGMANENKTSGVKTQQEKK